MKFGHFDDQNKEYVITTPQTPLPWINYLGSEDFFSLVSNTAGGKSFSNHSSNRECGGKCSGFSVSCSVVWKSCRAFFGREPCNLVQKESAFDDRFLCVEHSPVFELFGFASMGWICAESVAALHTGLIGG